jgi:hypothetical protein
MGLCGASVVMGSTEGLGSSSSKLLCLNIDFPESILAPEDSGWGGGMYSVYCCAFAPPVRFFLSEDNSQKCSLCLSSFACSQSFLPQSSDHCEQTSEEPRGANRSFVPGRPGATFNEVAGG